MTSPEVSVVVPFLNEEGSLRELHGQLSKVLDKTGRSYEIILVDDGSTDGGFQIASDLYLEDEHVKVLRFRRNFGKAAALQAGFDNAGGELVFTMDADLQDSPSEIPRFLAKLEEGFDVVSGWKQVRRDPVGKTAPSKLFNAVTRSISGIEIHDFNCGFKLYRREVLNHLSLYGELHRYIPVLAGWKGFRVGEIAVEHKAREHGQSKYGVERVLKGMFDLLTIIITRKYERRPLHVFGLLGLLSTVVGGVALTYLTVLWLFGGGPIGNRPLLFFGILAVIMGVQLVSFGLLAEMLVKLEDRFSKDFAVAAILSHHPKSTADVAKRTGSQL